MSNINLDINTYNTEELKNLFKLPKNYNIENICKSKESIANSIHKSNISESKKTEILIFLDNIKNKLITSLEIAENSNSIKQYNGNHYIINKNESILGNYKLANKSTLQKKYTIDSIFRHNYDLIDNQSHNYTMKLPETITRAISMSISYIEIPLTYHNISNFYNNNIFNIEILDESNNIIETKILELSPGLYEANILANLSRAIGYNIETEINNKLSTIVYADISNNLNFAIEPISGYGSFTYTNSNNYSNNNLGSYKIKINFNVNNQNTNTSANATNCYSNEIHQKLGWQLGFRSNSIILDVNNLYAISLGVCHINYPRYIYIAIDDFQSSSQNNFAIASESIVAPNIIARINILSLLEEKTRFKQGSYVGDSYYNQKHAREYFGPTDINKLKIQLLDEYGRPFSLNNMDWSFIMTLECLYN